MISHAWRHTRTCGFCLVLAAALAVLLAGCGSSTEPEQGSLELFTDVTTYGAGDPITVTVLNRTRSPVMVMQCKGRLALAVDQRVNGNWTNVAGTGCADATELAIEPAGNVSEFRLIAEPGTYRFVVSGRRAADDFGSLTAASNTFTVE